MNILNIFENETKEAMFRWCKEQYDGLQLYSIVDDYYFSDDSDANYPTHVALIIPFDEHCVIITITGLDESGNLVYEIKGKTSSDLHDTNIIALYDLWFLDNDSIYTNLIESFGILNLDEIVFYEDKEDSLGIVVCDKKFISKVIRRIINYYCTDRYAYQCFNKIDETIELEI